MLAYLLARRIKYPPVFPRKFNKSTSKSVANAITACETNKGTTAKQCANHWPVRKEGAEIGLSMDDEIGIDSREESSEAECCSRPIDCKVLSTRR